LLSFTNPLNGIGLLSAALWIFSLAVLLAMVGYARSTAALRRTSLRLELARPVYQIGLNAAGAVFCLGALLGSRAAWQQVLWILIGVAFLAQMMWVLFLPVRRRLH
jgi:hypothetical protein